MLTKLIENVFLNLSMQATGATSLPDSGNAMNLPQQSAEATISLFDLLIKGGVIMIPIGLLSLITLYLFFERLFFIRKRLQLDRNFIPTIKDHMFSGNLPAALSYAKGSHTAIGNIIEKGLSRMGKPVQEIESAMESIANVEIMKMERNLGFLGIIAGIAPMLGFIGTISGIIKIFYNISLSDNISVGIIAGGLYEKMITSGAGLIVGVLSYVGYHYLNTLIDKFTLKAETTSIQFLDLLQEK